MKSIVVMAATAAFAALIATHAAGQTYRGAVDPGQFLALKVAADGSVSVESESMNQLTESALDSVDAVPSWLAPDLAEALRRADASTQDALAQLILGVGDPYLVDEVAYGVAHLAPEDAAAADLELLVRNAEMIYEIAAELDYAVLEEVGEGDDRYTTLTYRILGEEGEELWTLPRDDYYAWVVQPQRDDGALHLVDPTTGGDADAPDGQFFREYLWNGAGGLRSYGTQRALRAPNLIDDAWLGSADFGDTAPSHGVLEGFEIDPIVLVRDAESGGAVAVTFVGSGGGCHSAAWPNTTGWVYATTIPVEAAAAAGDGGLLENLLLAGGGNLQLRDDVLADPASFTGTDAGVLIVRDRIPFGLAADPSDAILESAGLTVTAVDSTAFSALPLVAEEIIDPDPEVDGDEYVRRYPDGYSKIVVASDQPYSLYEALVARTEAIETFVAAGGVLELHLATRPADDWSGLRMPTGIRCGGQAVEDYGGGLEAYGYPRLADAIAGAAYLWDGTRIPWSDGILPLEEGMTAVERLGWWASQMLSMNVAEQAVWARTYTIERSVMPERIAWNHYGNCGELQDLITAAGRAALIPVMPVSTLADDHVWNEFIYLDQWHPLQTSWSDSGWHVDNFGVAADADTGGGKTISGMTGWSGDGRTFDLLGRYETWLVDKTGHIDGDYSRHVTLAIEVTDQNGEPVDGAQVTLATESLYDPTALAFVTWGYTGRDGVAEFAVGEENAYWYQVASGLGVLPEAEHVTAWLTAADTAEANQLFETTVAYESGALPVLPEPELRAPEAVAGDPVLAVDVVAEREVLAGAPLDLVQAYFGRTFLEPISPGRVDVYVVDPENYAKLSEGQEFEAADAVEQAEDASLEARVPAGSEWYVVVSNLRRQASSQQVTVDVGLEDGGVVDAGDGGGGGGGCGCRAAGSGGSGSSLLRMLL